MNIIQIGCHDGNDNVFDFIKQNYDKISNCYLIEPLVEVLELAKKNYKDFTKVKFYNLAIVEDEKVNQIEIFYPEDLSQSQTTSIFESHAKKHQTNVKSRFIKCCTINKFIEDNQIEKIDRLYIDTEGLDCKIINSVDLLKHNIDYLEFEYVHSDGTDNFGEFGVKTINRLIDVGYTVYKSPPFNMVAIKK